MFLYKGIEVVVRIGFSYLFCKGFTKHTYFLGTGRESPLHERLCCDCVLRSFRWSFKENMELMSTALLKDHPKTQTLYYSVFDCCVDVLILFTIKQCPKKRHAAHLSLPLQHIPVCFADLYIPELLHMPPVQALHLSVCRDLRKTHKQECDTWVH